MTSQNRKKIYPPPLSQNVFTDSTPSSLFRADTPKNSKLHQKVRTSASEEPPSPLVRKMSALDKLPLPTDCECPLWTVPNFGYDKLILKSSLKNLISYEFRAHSSSCFKFKFYE